MVKRNGILITYMNKKFLFLLFSVIPLLSFSQYKQSYKEFNIGAITTGEVAGFPGASFLWGRTIYKNDHLIFDYQFGLAFPTLVTGKIGVGVIFYGANAFSLGIRPWPNFVYFQYTARERWVFSIEYMLINISTIGIESIFNIGYRW